MMKLKTLKFSVLLFCYSLAMWMLSFLFINLDSSVILELDLVSISTVPFTFTLILDKISVSFSMLVTLISGSVFLFSNKYMEEDPFSNRFIMILLSFVISMNLLIFSGSVFFLFLGWDGLGITSFALIIYYQSKESKMAGFQTLLINRLGDVIIVLSIYMFLSSGQFTIYMISEKIYYSCGFVTLLCVAALTKSAQFPFSSWLPAAMAAPTPVSALVHSSTLVTAGIFIIIRLSYSMPVSANISSILLLCGSLTCLLGGWSASYENDIKKVIALSTLSQLGVMVFSLGMNYPSLGLFHLYTHALFKALLFLSAGHILMITFGNQDVRMFGGIGMAMPFTCLMFTISSLCLIGMPFLSAFYSKHLILELMMESPMNLLSMVTMMVATVMTAKYVMRTLKNVLWSTGGMPLISGCSNIFSWAPVSILGVSSIVGGNLITSVEVSNLEVVFIPSSYSLLVNLLTMMGIILGLFSVSEKLNSYSLSTLFYLTPLIYGTPKIFYVFLNSMSVLDYGWLEPYYIIKNRVYWSGSIFSEQGYWPNSRIIISVSSFMIFFMIGSMFVY